jgi:hypothetical protein
MVGLLPALANGGWDLILRLKGLTLWRQAGILFLNFSTSCIILNMNITGTTIPHPNKR